MSDVKIKLTRSQAEALLNVMAWLDRGTFSPIETVLRSALGIPEPAPSLIKWKDGLWENKDGSTPKTCQASRGDGECFWRGCPQIRDEEPERSGRHCPLDNDNEEDC